MLFHLQNLCLMLLGYGCVYESVFLFFDLSKQRTVFGIQCNSDFTFTLLYTFCSLFLVYPGVALLNFGYLREARMFEGNLWHPYFMAALAMITMFGLLNRLQRGTPFDGYTIAAISLYILANIVKNWKYIVR